MFQSVVIFCLLGKHGTAPVVSGTFFKAKEDEDPQLFSFPLSYCKKCEYVEAFSLSFN